MSGIQLLWSLLPRGHCRRLLLAALGLSSLAAAASLIPALVIAAIAAVIFDRIDVGLSVMQVVFIGIAAVIARLGLLLLARNTAGSATELLSASLRARAAVTIGALPLGEIAATPAGAFETILLDDVEAVGQYVSGGLVDVWGAASTLAAAALVLLVVNWRWAALTLVLGVAAALVLRVQTRRADTEIERERAAREKLAAAVFGAFRAVPLRRSLPGAQDAVNPVRALADEDSRALDVRQRRGAALWARRVAFATSLPAIAILAIVVAGGSVDLPRLVLFAAVGLRSMGALAAAFRAVTAASEPFERAVRVRALLDRPPAPDGDMPLPDDTTLRFNHVDFSYPDAGSDRRLVLHDIDFTAAAGRVTAIVGPSGSGKTTLTRLAARLWDVDRGAVTLGGVDLRALPLDGLMRRVSCVFQDVALLDDTVAANLKLGRPDAADDEMERAAAAAGADGFIRGLPAGYATLVGDRGLHLSRGERQRLQIARALLKDAPVIILDEPTASLDPATEFEIQTALAPLLRGKTVLVVAHRLTTVVAADRIVVLGSDGRIEAQGRHADLLATSSTYARLWTDYRTSVDWTLAPSAVPR